MSNVARVRELLACIHNCFVSLTICACEQEQTSIAKLGLELRLLSSDVDTEVEKWEEQEHDVVRQSQSLASMAYNMHLFTR